MNKDKIGVSICMITYNHESYIVQAIEGVLMQKTNFAIELVIGEDCSTDRTYKICIACQEKYPDVIKLKLPDRNLGVMPNFIQTLNSCSGKYIALCEGDDYWTDPYKLQKQVDFLEANEEFVICFHNASVFNEENQKEIFQQPGIDKDKIFTIFDFLNNNPCPTASVLLRSEYINTLPEWFTKTPFGDYTLYLLILSKSSKNAFYFKDTMCVYRIHSGGVHGNAHLSNSGMIKAYKEHIKFWKVITKYLTKNQFRKEIGETLAKDYSLIINYLLKDKEYIAALKYNTIFLFKLYFSFLRINMGLYKKILRQVSHR